MATDVAFLLIRRRNTSVYKYTFTSDSAPCRRVGRVGVGVGVGVVECGLKLKAYFIGNLSTRLFTEAWLMTIIYHIVSYHVVNDS